MARLTLFCRSFGVGYGNGITALGWGDAYNLIGTHHSEPIGLPTLRGIIWQLNREGTSPYEAYDTLTRESGRAPSTRIPNLEEFFAGSEAVLMVRDGIGSLSISPKHRADFIQYVLHQEALGRGLVFSSSATIVEIEGAPAPSVSGLFHRHEPLFADNFQARGLDVTDQLPAHFRVLSMQDWDDL